ncbi:probable G-protein coupled receptor 33 [Tiliqua scincoides]|uniref:probable G-protein coupled receptor 33 n=1 Tax=Tiliqua scincoides TaxID=71010 RepID=UPI0034632E98
MPGLAPAITLTHSHVTSSASNWVFFPSFLQGLVHKGDMAVLPENASATGMNVSHAPIAKSPSNLTVGFLILMSFLVGAATNGLFLWVLGLKMKRTVNTLWFSHLILAYLIFCLLLPVFAVHSFQGFQWVFGTVMCKLINTFGSLAMFTNVFLLTIISLDRYLLTYHPVWSQYNRTIPRAQRLVLGVWLVSLILSAPYLAFRETQEVEGHIKCVNNYALFSSWDGAKVHLAFFVVRFLLSFLIPCVMITSCYYWMFKEMKKKNLVRTGKPFKVLVAAVASFFLCYVPYHLYYASLLITGVPEMLKQVMWSVMAVAACFNFCFTPILYVFVGEKFQQVFKTSVVALLKKGFVDAANMSGDKTNTGEEDQINHNSSLEMPPP